MEDLLSAIDESLEISPEEECLQKRKSLFKFNSRAEISSRDKRRAQLLEDFKRKRDALVDEKRGLLNLEFNDNDEWMDWQEAKKKRDRKINNHCKNQLMLSEWLLDRPHDLETSWTAVVCPEGRRTLVIAKRGCTKAYHKSGFLLATIKSVLPNGAPLNRTKNSDTIILDCIWKESTKQLFALDVLHWKNQAILNCDAQFRLYWLKSKLSEVRQSLTSKSLEGDIYDVYLPPHCTLSTLSTTIAELETSEVDGILFYHNMAPYISGQTPLVGWLKPYMLTERLGIMVPPQYESLKPDNYLNLEQWVAEVSHSHSRKPKENHQMETDSLSGKSLDSSETLSGDVRDISNTTESVMDSG